MMEYVLWGTEKGQPSYMEECLADRLTEKPTNFSAYPNYDRFRVSTFTPYGKPNFIGAINK